MRRKGEAEMMRPKWADDKGRNESDHLISASPSLLILASPQSHHFDLLICASDWLKPQKLCQHEDVPK